MILNPLKYLITKIQKSAIYASIPDPINIQDLQIKIPGIKLVEFEDENKVKHRFLYKPPKANNTASTNVFFCRIRFKFKCNELYK